MKIFRKKTGKKPPGPSHAGMQECQNCGHKDSGNYCSNCGQRFSDLNRPFNELFSDLVGAFNFDERFFRTIVPFLFKPGFLTTEYLDGRRKKYMSPLRLYLFLSILFFFIARISTNQTSADGNDVNIIFNQDSTTVISEEDSMAIQEIIGDSLDFRSQYESITQDTVLSEREQRVEENLKTAIEDPSYYADVFLRNLSYALFLLMPLFAAILMLLYIRRNRYYIAHLLFSINMHSFVLLVLTIIFGLQLLLKDAMDILQWIALVLPVYFVIGMKRFYGQGIGKVIMKTILTGLIYGFLLFVTLIFLLVMTLVWM